jgi:hypothetical protein
VAWEDMVEFDAVRSSAEVVVIALQRILLV